MDEIKLSGAVIKRREELNLTQEGLVAYIGEDKISLSTIKRVERRVKISDNKAMVIITALNMDYRDFMVVNEKRYF